MLHRPFRRLRPTENRTRRHWQPEPVAVLEGRALLTAVAANFYFGSGGSVVGQPVANTFLDTGATTAVAVQSDGKIVTASLTSLNNGTGATPTAIPLVVQRFNSNGTVDPTFGTGGQTIIPLSGTSTSQPTQPKNLVIQSDGSILVAAGTGPTTTNSTLAENAVVRLTSTGALDSTFGTGGVAVLPSTILNVNSVVVLSSGEVIVAGSIAPNTGTNTTSNAEVVVLGLTPTGTLDSTFGTGGQVVVPGATATSSRFTVGSATIIGLQVTTTNQILLANSFFEYTAPTPSPAFDTNYTISRINANGTIDATFGTGGSQPLGGRLSSISTFAVGPDGSIVLGGTGNGVIGNSNFQVAGLVRLTANGSVDPSFAPTAESNNLESINSLAIISDGSITALTNGNVVARFTKTGVLDKQFGQGGLAGVFVPKLALPSGTTSNGNPTGRALAYTATGNIVIAGALLVQAGDISTVAPVLTQLRTAVPTHVLNDYNGDGRSDLAAALPQFGAFALQTDNGTLIQPFGPTGAGQAIPAPGDYDGDGKADPAVYLPNLGVLAIRSLVVSLDSYSRFGPTGAGAAIPAPGDYDGDGKTDVALYLPGPGAFIVQSSLNAFQYQVQFGIAGTGNSIPVPGDYDGSGKTEFAVYLPTLGALVYRPANGGADVAIPFGPVGVGASIPVPGDFDGDGKSDVALYLPGSSTFLVRPSGGAAPYPVTFGSAGVGASIPAPGDYDGDGKTDIAVLLTNSAVFAIAPSGGGSPYARQFGAAGAGNTVPATVVPMPVGISPQYVFAYSAADPNAGVPVFLDDATPPRKKPSA